MSKLYRLDETGATYVFVTEEDARRAAADEQARGLHVHALTTLEVPEEDHAAYALAVREDVSSAHLHPVFLRADRGDYPGEVEQFCAGRCAEDGDDAACEAATVRR